MPWHRHPYPRLQYFFTPIICSFPLFNSCQVEPVPCHWQHLPPASHAINFTNSSFLQRSVVCLAVYRLWPRNGARKSFLKAAIDLCILSKYRVGCLEMRHGSPVCHQGRICCSRIWSCWRYSPSDRCALTTGTTLPARYSTRLRDRIWARYSHLVRKKCPSCNYQPAD